MRFMVIIKGNEKTETGAPPDARMLSEMNTFNEELIKAGVMVSGDGLLPSTKGARVKFSGAKRTVIDGPFAEAKELVAGYWIWKCASKAEALEWVKRIPNPTGEEGVVELRQIAELEDFPAVPDEVRQTYEKFKAGH